MKTSKILIVVGPTASGKSELAVKLAKKYNGEIISADSRQIYRGLDIGSGKVEGKWQRLPSSSHPESLSSHPERILSQPIVILSERSESKDPRLSPGDSSTTLGMTIISHSEQSRTRLPAGRGSQKQAFIYKNIPHYLIDEASPRVQYSVARFQQNARKIIADILKRDKLPIICGGTMHWIDAVVFEQSLPEVKPDAKIRKQLSQLSVDQMFEMLKRLDPERAKTIDAKNPHRLIRALEIVKATGKPVPKIPALPSLNEGKIREGSYDATWLGINPDKEILETKIQKRLKQRLKQGLVEEVQSLHNSGLSWKKLEDFGLEYKYCALYLQNKLNKAEMEEQLFIAIRQYAKRQMTWWKRNKNIRWHADAFDALNDTTSIFS